MQRLRDLGSYAGALLAVAVSLGIIALLEAILPTLAMAFLLYLVPIILAASTWGRGRAIAAVIGALIGHDLMFVEPLGLLAVPRTDEAIGLALLLFTALVTSQLADSARRGTEKAQEATIAQRSDELKTALLRAVSHELRTPLASIKASVSSLRQAGGAYTEADRAELLEEIEEGADRLDRLVGNLLDASRLEAGVLTPRKRPEDLRVEGAPEGGARFVLVLPREDGRTA